MNKYIILKGDTVESIAVSSIPPSDTSILLEDGMVTPSRDWKYDSTTNKFYSPLSYYLTTSPDSISNSGNLLLSSGSYSMDISCHFDRGINSLTLESLSLNEPLVVSNFSNDTSNNTVSFTITTGSLELGEADEYYSEIRFKPQIVEDLGYSWDLNPISILITKN
jgi:hypothetical protein